MKLYNLNIFKEISPEEEKKNQRKTNTGTLSLIFLLVCFLYWDSNKDPEIGNRKLVGIVTSAVNQTERKLGATVVWRKIIKDYSVYNYDTIRTEADSKTVIELTDGTKVTLNEDTIIYINTNPEKLDINLIQGSMTVDTMNRKESEVEKINIVHGNEVIKVDRSFLSISKKKSSSSLNLELKEGEALLRKEDKEYILQKGNTVISKKDFIKELNIQYQGVSDESGLAQDFRKKQAEKGRVGGVQIVKSGNQYILLGQDDKGRVREVRIDKDSQLGREIGKPESVQEKGKILQGALASLGMGSAAGLYTDDTNYMSWNFLKKNTEGLIIYPAEGTEADIGEMKVFVFLWKNPDRLLFRIRLFRKNDGKTVFDQLVDSDSYSVQDFTQLKRGFYRFSVSSEDGSVQAETQFSIRLREIDSDVKFKTPEKVYVD